MAIPYFPTLAKTTVMKRLFSLAAIIFIAFNSGFAQQNAQAISAKTMTASKEPVKVAFNKKLTELKDMLKKGDKEAATKSYMDMFELMHKAMGVNNEKLTKATSETERAKFQNMVTQEQTLYSEIKAQLVDIIGNKEVLISKLEEYAKTIQ